MHIEPSLGREFQQPHAFAIGRSRRKFINNRDSKSGFGEGDRALGEAHEVAAHGVHPGIGKNTTKHLAMHGAWLENQPVPFEGREIAQFHDAIPTFAARHNQQRPTGPDRNRADIVMQDRIKGQRCIA